MPVRDFKRAPRSVNRLTAYGALPGEKMKIVNATTYETELDGLKHYSWYQIRIGAVTSKGLGVTFTVNGTCKQGGKILCREGCFCLSSRKEIDQCKRRLWGFMESL